MNTSKILICAVVLWTSLEARNVDRITRSLDIDGKGGNLTQKQQQEVIHSDVLQHFTTSPPPPRVVEQSLPTASGGAIPGLFSDVPSLPEDIKVQNLKNDDQLHLKYEKKIALDRKYPKEDVANEQNKTAKSKTNYLASYNFDQTGTSSSTQAEVSIARSIYDQLSSSASYNWESSAKDESGKEETRKTQTVTSSTEKLETNLDWKTYEGKKKEKSKKEIVDSATVPTDLSGAGSLEKPYKENIISAKLKEEGKDSISEALDDQRSTTIRISNSSSDSISEHDNNAPLTNLDVLLASSPDVNYEELVNQSVSAVINGNSVNSEISKQHREKYSVKREHESVNDTDADNSSANGNLLNEDATKDNVQLVNVKIQTTPTSYVEVPSMDKLAYSKNYNKQDQSRATESTPLKLDILPSHATPSAITVVKPSIAFKQQLANKIKALEPSPTAPMNTSDNADENQDKSIGKPVGKLNVKKKFPEIKQEYHSTTSELNIPPTATAWSLASMRSPADSLRTSRRPAEKGPLPVDDSEDSPPSTQTTGTLASKVKPFVPWSVKLQSSSTNPPTSTDGDQHHFQFQNESKNINTSLEPPTVSTTEGQTVIWTTLELDRNITEGSDNQTQPTPSDVMVKDQSSSASQESFQTPMATTQIPLILNSSTGTLETSNNAIKVETNFTEKENIIDTKITGEEVEKDDKAKNDLKELLDDKNSKIVSSNSSNEISSPGFSENLNDVKVGIQNDSLNKDVVTTTAVPTLAPDIIEGLKTKNMSEIGDLSDTGTGDIHVDGNEDVKSVEESDEDDKPKLTSTTLPLQDNFETTISPDLDEDVDVDGDGDREEEDLPLVSDKAPGNQTVEKTNDTSPIIYSSTKPTTPSPVTVVDLNITTTIGYVTSFDVIVPKDNKSQVVTKSPSEVDKNWYSVDSTPASVTAEESSQESYSGEINTTAALDTTPVPETTTETSKRETTIKPEADISVFSTSPSTASPTIETTTSVESDGDMLPASCVRIQLHESAERICQSQRQLRNNIAAQLVPLNVSWEQVLIMSAKLEGCDKKEQSTEDELIDIDICFIDKDENPSPTIRDEFLKVYSEKSRDPTFRIVGLQMMRPEEVTSGFDTVLAAIILSVIAAICLLLLGILLVIVRKRQGGLNYPQRCTPVSLDDYSLDNISVCNSVRRKGGRRASKRSYGNPGFDDPGGPTHVINFAGLANFSGDRKALDEEFNQIPMITVKSDELPPGVEGKNRYANVIPIPETRLSLQTKEGDAPTDEYINANYIKGTKCQEKSYIACQAPLQSTVEDFWKMVWQEQTKVILMLTALNENGVEKCADYLPQLEITDCHRIFGDFQVTLKKHEVREKYIISSLQIKNLDTNLWREVTHMWYSSWPSQGVPEDGSAMIAFLIEARSYMRGAQGPTVVHCSPGTGRTGAVIAIDLCIRDFETLRSVDIPKTVYALRRDRAGAVQTKDQYAFIYQVLNLYATKLTGGVLDSI